MENQKEFEMLFTRTTLLSAVSAVALMAAAPAFAADMNTKGDMKSSTEMKSSAGGASADMQAGAKIEADELLDSSIENAAGETIGDVNSVLVDRNGKVAAVIVGVGGFLGMGEREVALDWSQLQIRGENKIVASNLTKAQLKSMPEYKYGDAKQRNTAFVDEGYLDRRANDARDLAERAGDGIKSAADSVGTAVSGAADRAGTAIHNATDDNKWVAATDVTTDGLTGAEVVNTQGESIGEVENVVTVGNKSTLIVSVGEFLGIGGREVALPVDSAQIQRQVDDPDDIRVQVSMSKDDLEKLPAYEK